MNNKLDDARVKLMALASNPVSKRQTLEAQILALKPAISEARKTGHTYTEIVGELRKAGINIEASTLKTYWSKIMRAEAVPEPQPAPVLNETPPESGQGLREKNTAPCPQCGRILPVQVCTKPGVHLGQKFIECDVDDGGCGFLGYEDEK